MTQDPAGWVLLLIGEGIGTELRDPWGGLCRGQPGSDSRSGSRQICGNPG
jgi:hypothetical protein